MTDKEKIEWQYAKLCEYGEEIVELRAEVKKLRWLNDCLAAQIPKKEPTVSLGRMWYEDQGGV